MATNDGPEALNEDAWTAAWERAEREDAMRRIRLRAAKLPARRQTGLNPVTVPTGGKL